MYNFIKALSKKPRAGTFPFSEYILGCFQSGGLKTLQVESPSLFLDVSSAAWASEVRLPFLAVFVHLRRWELFLTLQQHCKAFQQTQSIPPKALLRLEVPLLQWLWSALTTLSVNPLSPGLECRPHTVAESIRAFVPQSFPSESVHDL